MLYMIRGFKHKGLRKLFETGKSKRINAELHERALRCLDALDQAAHFGELKTPSLRCHKLQGHNPERYAISVSGPWRITFEFDEGDAFNVDLEQYH